VGADDAEEIRVVCTSYISFRKLLDVERPILQEPKIHMPVLHPEILKKIGV
jgi:hypothetical protein